MHEEQKSTEEAASAENLYTLEPEIHKIDEQRRQQLVAVAKKYNKLQIKFQNEPFFTRTEYYVLSIRWLNRWKVYVGYTQVNGAVPLNKYFGCGKLPTANQDLVEAQKKDSIAYTEQYHNFNIRLKIGLQQSKDYVFITKQMYYAIKECEYYEMIRIPREVAKTKQGKKVELYYFQINLLLMFNSVCKDIQLQRISKFYEMSLQFSHYSTLKDFIQVVKPIIKSFLNSKRTVEFDYGNCIRLWLLPLDTRKTILHNIFQAGCKVNQSYKYKLYLDAELMDDDKQLNQYDIMEDSLIMTEIKETSQNWLFYNSTHVLEGTCNYCKEKKLLKHLCSCKYAAYCSSSCRSKDKYSHKSRCPNDAESQEEEAELALTPKSKKGMVGLRNLGNTCFMNSGLQCLSHIKELTEYFVNNQYLKDVNKENPLGTKGEISIAYAKMAKNLWLGSESSFSPAVLKRVIGKYQPMFSGYQQHDASELVNYLLDLLHEDLNRVKVKPYVETKQSNNRPDNQVAREAWENFLMRNQSLIVDQMFGQFKSIVDCPKCQYSSVQFDPFSVCSLPIINDSQKYIELTYIRNHIEQTKVTINYDIKAKNKLQFAINELRKKLSIDPKTNLVTYVASYSTCEVITADKSIQQTRKQYKYKTIYVRELLPNQDPSTDIKVMLNNTYCHSIYGNQHYRKNIVPSRLYFFSQNSTNKQIHFKIYSYYKKYYQVASYENDVIKQVEKQQPFRILCIPTSHYMPCDYCKKKNCEGCTLPFDDKKFMDDIKIYSKVEMEIYWRKNAKEIQAEMQKMLTSTGKDSPSKAKTGTTIQQCFELFEEPEILGEDNAWYCPKCKDLVLAKKQMKIYKAPNILVLTLKRFKAKQYFNEKYTIFVDYPLENFDITKYVLDPELPGQKASKNSKLSDGVKQKVIYDLIGVSNHMGSTGGGHFTAYCRDIESQKWFQFDDSMVSPMKNPLDVVSQSGYILFYRRKDME